MTEQEMDLLAKKIAEPLVRSIESLKASIKTLNKTIFDGVAEDAAPIVDYAELSAAVLKYGLQDKLKCGSKSCQRCHVKKRNKCWHEVEKHVRHESLRSRIPFTDEQLRKSVSHRDMVIILKLLGENYFKLVDKTSNNVIETILKLQKGIGNAKISGESKSGGKSAA